MAWWLPLLRWAARSCPPRKDFLYSPVAGQGNPTNVLVDSSHDRVVTGSSSAASSSGVRPVPNRCRRLPYGFAASSVPSRRRGQGRQGRPGAFSRSGSPRCALVARRCARAIPSYPTPVIAERELQHRPARQYRTLTPHDPGAALVPPHHASSALAEVRFGVPSTTYQHVIDPSPLVQRARRIHLLVPAWRGIDGAGSFIAPGPDQSEIPACSASRHRRSSITNLPQLPQRTIVSWIG